MKTKKSVCIFISLFVAMLGLTFVSQLVAQVEQPEPTLVDIYKRPLPDRHEPGLAPTNSAPEPNAPTAPDAGIFGPYVRYAAAGAPDGVGIGDFNHDGLNDVATSNAATMRVLLQTTNGTLTTPVNYVSGNRSESLIIGDLNQDHLDDIATVNFNDDTISIYRQQANGTMSSRDVYNTSDGPDASATADLNNDCRTDIVIPHWRAANISTYYQQENGSLLRTSYSSTTAGYDDIDTGDVNGDGLMDVVKMNGQLYANPNFLVYLQTPEGTLANYIPYDLPGNQNASGIAVGDVTGDGLDDVVFSYGGNKPASKIAVFSQTNDGNLIHSATYNAYDIPESVEISDVNMDGRSDILVLHGGWNRLGVFLQNSGGTLAPYELYPIPYASHYQPQGLDVGDINDDGTPDVAIGDYNYGLVVLYNILPSFRLTAQPATLTTSPNSSISTNVFITPANGFTSNVALTLNGLPPHIDYTISSNPVSLPGEVTVTFTTTEETGTYTLELQGTGNGITRTIPLVLNVGDTPITCLSAFNSSPTEIGSTTYFTATTASGSNITYTWDYADGHTGTGNPSSHNYAIPGRYQAVVTATNAVSTITATTNVTILEQPITDLLAANSSPTEVGNTTYLTATTASGSNIIYNWDYGNGQMGTGNPAAHTYASPGTYQAIVTATNSVSTLTASTTVTILESTIILSATNSSPTEVGHMTYLTATAESDEDLEFLWDLGQGVFRQGQVVSYTYPALGIYEAVVTATTSTSSQSASTFVDIVDVPIVGLLAENDSPTILGESTWLTASVTTGTNLVYTWDLGDSTIVSGSIISHVYPALGTYTVVLTGFNSTSELTAYTTVVITEINELEPNLVYLPLVINQPATPDFPIFIGAPISPKPVIVSGETFYSIDITIPENLPQGGQFFLSAKPNKLVPVVVDDELIILKNGSIIFSNQFSAPGITPASEIVNIPSEILSQLTGQVVTVAYRDVYGFSVAASEMWLVWVSIP